MHRLVAEIVQSAHSRDYRSQGFGDREVARVGNVAFAVHLVSMHLRVECLFHLARRTAEFQGAAAAADLIHPEAVLLQPRHYGVDILLGRAEALTELFGGEPLPEVRRGGVVLAGE